MKNNNAAYPLHRTKIYATVGPTCQDLATLRKIALAGVTVFRINFSHGSQAQHTMLIERIRQLEAELQRPLMILLDTKGPEIRVGQMKDGQQEIFADSTVTIDTSREAYQNLQGTSEMFSISAEVAKNLKPGSRVCIDDGKLELRVEQVKAQKVIAKALNDHLLITNKRVNLPGVEYNLPFLSAKDKKDLQFGLQSGIDAIAGSFVNTVQDIQEIRTLVKASPRPNTIIIAKIESQIGANNYEAIIQAADGIMVARGDLALEIPFYKVPYYERQLIKTCRRYHKITVVATQMLDSMTYNPTPTRAEVTDVYYATLLGADATMLSGETANGDFPVKSVECMAIISSNANLDRDQMKPTRWEETANKIKAWSLSADDIQIVKQIVMGLTKHSEVRLVILPTNSQQLLKCLSWLRLSSVVLAVTTNLDLARHFNPYFGISIFIINDLKLINWKDIVSRYRWQDLTQILLIQDGGSCLYSE